MEAQKGQCSEGCQALVLKNTKDVSDRTGGDESALFTERVEMCVDENDVGVVAIRDDEV